MENPVSYSALSAALPRLGFDQPAAEYHGALCGALCVRMVEEVDVLQVLQAIEPDEHDLAAGSLLNSLRAEAVNALANGVAPPQLLLPDDALPLALRAAALGEWCEGFLYGLASRKGFDLKKASEDVREVVQDFAEFTRMGFEDSDDEETQEAAYAELVEYVRVGAQLVFLELTPTTNKAVH